MSSCPHDQEILDAVKCGSIKPLVLALYARDVGYTLTLPGKNCIDGLTTQLFDYDKDSELLIEFVQHCRLPYVFIDLVEEFCVNRVFYKGCLVVDVRFLDHHPSELRSAKLCRPKDSKMLILRPTMLSMMHDLNILMAEGVAENLSSEELDKLESEFWRLSSSQSTIDDDDEQVTTNVNELQRQLEKCGVDLGQLKHTRRQKLETQVAISGRLKVFAFLEKNTSRLSRNRFKPRPDRFLVTRDLSPSSWKPMIPAAIKSPEAILEKKCLLNLEEKNSQTLHCEFGSLLLMEEYEMEFLRPSPSLLKPSNSCNVQADNDQIPIVANFKLPGTKIALFRRQSDWATVGRLTLDRGSTHLDVVESYFHLGHDWMGRAYVAQYLDMVSEGGRKPARVTHCIRNRRHSSVSMATLPAFVKLKQSSSSAEACGGDPLKNIMGME